MELTIIWLVGVVILLMVLTVLAGFTGDNEVFAFIPVMVGWPLMIAAGIVLLPFFGLYYLGAFLKSRSE